MIFPIVLFVVIGIVQTALWAHANSVAQAAADHGAEVAAAFGSDGLAGETAATNFLASVAAVQNATATASTDPTTEQVTMVVTASYPSVFGLLDVRATAVTIRERPGTP